MTQEETASSGRATVAKNAFYLVLGQVTTTALAIVFSAALGRTLGVRDFGVYFLISSFSMFAYVLVDWGQQFYIMREVARAPERGSELLGTALALRTLGGALVAIPSGLVAWALGYDTSTCWYSVAFIVTSLPFFLAQSYGMVFRGRDRMGLDAFVSVINKIATLALCLAALSLGTSLPGVLVGQALAGIVALIIATQLYRRVTTGPLHYSSQVAREVLLGGGALFTVIAATNLQPYLDVIILSKLAPADAVGLYGAAKNIMGTMLAPALIVSAASFPRLTRAAANRAEFKLEARAALRPMLFLGALAAVGTFLFADDAISIVYGHRHFGPSGMILKVYAPGFFLLFIDVLLGYMLLSLGRGGSIAGAKVASLAVSTALEVVLIPIFQHRFGNGGIGVVTAFVISEVVVFGGAISLLPRGSLGLDVAVDMGRAVGSGALTLLLFRLLPRLPFLVGLPVCLIAFLLGSIALGLVRRADVQLFRALLRKQRSVPSQYSAALQQSGSTPIK